MSAFRVFVDENAIRDVHKAIDYYNDKVPGLGRKFSSQFKQAIKVLKANPHFMIRYDEIRCLPLKSFPYMVHYIIDERVRLIEVFGVINTSLDSNENWFN